MINFNFYTDVDLAQSGTALLKSTGFLMMATMFEGIDINSMHVPAIILELAKLFAYLGAGVSFFRFVLGLFMGPKKDKK